jgi:glutathione S-transferase
MASKRYKITVYHLNNSRAIRIISLLEELALPYTIVYMRRNATGQAPPSFNVHPLRKTPIVVIQHTPDSPEIVLHESAYIIDYICEYWGQQLLPKKFADEQAIPGTETEAWRRNKYWLVQPEGTLMPNVQITLLFYCKYVPVYLIFPTESHRQSSTRASLSSSAHSQAF